MRQVCFFMNVISVCGDRVSVWPADRFCGRLAGEHLCIRPAQAETPGNEWRFGPNAASLKNPGDSTLTFPCSPADLRYRGGSAAFSARATLVRSSASCPSLSSSCPAKGCAGREAYSYETRRLSHRYVQCSPLWALSIKHFVRTSTGMLIVTQGTPKDIRSDNGPDLRQGVSGTGWTVSACGHCLSNLEVHEETVLSNPSTESCVTSCLTWSCLTFCWRLECCQNAGSVITTRFVHTVHWATGHQRRKPCDQQ